MSTLAPPSALGPAPAWSEARFRAMGTDVHLSVLGDPGLLVDGRRRIEDLEARWSRFLADSTLSRLNRAGGRPVSVDDETFGLVALAVHAWRETGGRFDPTVLDAVVAAGYDRSFEAVDGSAATGLPGAPSPGCAGIRLDPAVDTVLLPEGVQLDLGGIGKGRAADLVARDLVRAGARAVVVNLGGDLRIGGPPLDAPLLVGIEDPFDPRHTAAVVALSSGALATSSRTRRRWRVAGEERHHLIDPRTGRPAETGLAAVSVIAADAVRAEVLAKAAFVAGAAQGPVLLERSGTSALLVEDDGRRTTVGAFAEHRP